MNYHIGGGSMKCAYCITNQYHMLVIQQPDGSFHVHAPFQDKKIMNKMLKDISKSMKEWSKNGQNKSTGSV